MAKKKSELESGYQQHAALCRRAEQAEAVADYPSALRAAESSLPYLGDALTYHRRFLKAGPPPLSSVRLILKLAPALFAGRLLTTVAAHFDQLLKAERTAVPDFREQLAVAGQTLTTAVRMWAELSHTPDAATHVSNADPLAADILRLWAATGWVARSGHGGTGLYKRTADLRRETRGKCPTCGAAQRSRVADLLEPLGCVRCGSVGLFVLLAPNEDG